MRKIAAVVMVMTVVVLCGSSRAVNSAWYQPYTTDAQTIGLWHFDDISDASTSFADSSGHGNTGSRPAWSTAVVASGAGAAGGSGLFGNAVNGSGSGWSHTVADGGNLGFASGSFTIEAWICPTAGDLSGTKGIVNKGGSSGFDFGIANGKLFVDTRTYTYESGVANTVLQANTWYHVAAVFATDYSAGWMEHVLFYVNGQLDADLGYPPFDGNWGYSSSSPLAIGVLDNTANGYSNFVGSIDEVRYSNGIRTFAPVPEPVSLILLGIGGLGMISRKRHLTKSSIVSVQ